MGDKGKKKPAPFKYSLEEFNSLRDFFAKKESQDLREKITGPRGGPEMRPTTPADRRRIQEHQSKPTPSGETGVVGAMKGLGNAALSPVMAPIMMLDNARKHGFGNAIADAVVGVAGTPGRVMDSLDPTSNLTSEQRATELGQAAMLAAPIAHGALKTELPRSGVSRPVTTTGAPQTKGSISNRVGLRGELRQAQLDAFNRKMGPIMARSAEQSKGPTHAKGRAAAADMDAEQAAMGKHLAKKGSVERIEQPDEFDLAELGPTEYAKLEDRYHAQYLDDVRKGIDEPITKAEVRKKYQAKARWGEGDNTAAGAQKRAAKEFQDKFTYDYDRANPGRGRMLKSNFGPDEIVSRGSDWPQYDKLKEIRGWDSKNRPPQPGGSTSDEVNFTPDTTFIRAWPELADKAMRESASAKAKARTTQEEQRGQGVLQKVENYKKSKNPGGAGEEGQQGSGGDSSMIQQPQFQASKPHGTSANVIQQQAPPDHKKSVLGTVAGLATGITTGNWIPLVSHVVGGAAGQMAGAVDGAMNGASEETGESPAMNTPAEEMHEGAHSGGTKPVSETTPQAPPLGQPQQPPAQPQAPQLPPEAMAALASMGFFGQPPGMQLGGPKMFGQV